MRYLVPDYGVDQLSWVRTSDRHAALRQCDAEINIAEMPMKKSRINFMLPSQ